MKAKIVANQIAAVGVKGMKDSFVNAFEAQACEVRQARFKNRDVELHQLRAFVEEQMLWAKKVRECLLKAFIAPADGGQGVLVTEKDIAWLTRGFAEDVLKKQCPNVTGLVKPELAKAAQ